MKKLLCVIFTLIFIACPIMATQGQAAVGDTVYLIYDKNIDEDVIGMPENQSALADYTGKAEFIIAQDANPTIQEYEHPDGQTYRYEFAGWYDQRSCYTQNTCSKFRISSTWTLYAKWNVTKTQTSPVITVKFDVNTDNIIYNPIDNKVLNSPPDRYIRVDAETYELDLSGIDVGDDGAPVREFKYQQYAFDGWCYNRTASIPANTGDIINKDTQCNAQGVITLYARWINLADIRIWHDETIENEESFTVSTKGFKGFKNESVELGATCSGINEPNSFEVRWSCNNSSISLTPSEDGKSCVVKYAGASRKNVKITAMLISPSGSITAEDTFTINYQKSGSIFEAIINFFLNLFK